MVTHENTQSNWSVVKKVENGAPDNEMNNTCNITHIQTYVSIPHNSRWVYQRDKTSQTLLFQVILIGVYFQSAHLSI